MGEMLERDGKQRADMVVVEPVVDVATVATVPHDARSAKQAKRLRHLGFAGVDSAGDLVDAHLVGVGERLKDTDSSRIAEQPKQHGGFVGEGRAA